MPEHVLSIETQAELIDLAYMAMIVRDLNDVILFWNRRAEEVYGWTKTEAIGRTTHELLKTEFPVSLQAVDAALAKDGRWEGQLQHTRRDGQVITVLSRQAIQRDAAGQPIAILEVNLDVTAQNQRHNRVLSELAQELAAERAFLEAVLRQMPAGVIIASPTGDLLLSNQQIERIWGKPFHQAGQIYDFTDFQGYHADGRPYAAQEYPLARAIKGGEVIESEEIEIIREDGTRATIRASAGPIRDAGGALMAGVVTFSDISESKELERALARASDALSQEAVQLEQRVQERTQRLQLLHQIDRAILAAQSPATTAQSVVTQLRRALGCDRVGVSLLDVTEGKAQVLAVDDGRGAAWPAGAQYEIGPDCPAVVQLAAGQAHVRLDAPTPEAAPEPGFVVAEGLASFVAIPLRVEERLIGVLNLGAVRPGAFKVEDVQLARQVADSLAVAIHHGQVLHLLQGSHAQLQALARQLVQVQEAERKSIARELHDEAGQALTSLTVSLGLLERRADCPPDIRQQLDGMKQLTDEVMDGLHRLAANLRPATLDRLGLVPALRQHVEMVRQQGQLEVTFITLGLEDVRLAPEVETTIYRVVVESLTNVLRHADAAHVGIVVERRGDQAVAVIEDDGQGFDAEAGLGKGRLGVFGMRERAEMLGGTLTVETAPGAGTTVFVEIPCASVAPAM